MATDDPVFDGICFHAQQSVEKYLKALLQEHEIPSPRTHDLVHLAELTDGRFAGIRGLASDLKWLTTFAVDIRYPGASATRADADRALQVAMTARVVFRAAVELSTEERGP
ncbi:MAG: HEPN domain-containing protein [Thermomicrobiales bacterium]